jgi:DNA primase
VREIISDELTFDDLICGTIFGEFRFASEQGTFLGDKVFIKNEDPAISSLSADILAESHQLSKIWRNKQTYVETEEMKLKDIVPDAVLKFKGDKIKLRLKEIMTRLEEAVRSGNQENIIVLQQKDQALKAALKTISKQMGNRILL